MTASLRALLVVSALLVCLFVLHKIRKAQLQVMDAVFWLLFSLSFVVLAVFPEIASTISAALGFQAASNFVFLYVIAILVMRDFAMTVKFARLRDRFESLVKEIALRQ